MDGAADRLNQALTVKKNRIVPQACHLPQVRCKVQHFRPRPKTASGPMVILQNKPMD
jgi:hypothetical protein